MEQKNELQNNKWCNIVWSRDNIRGNRFEIKDKDKIAIVGRNGCGKTSFLNSIVDNSMLEEGIGENKFNIYKQGNPSIGYLKQINFEDSSKTMLEEILKVYKPIIDLEEKYLR